MAQVKNTFVKSKMNRDSDARLIPNGEYREGRNINVSRSEGADVGALENVKGNASVLPGFINKLNQGLTPNEKPLEVIGMFTHEDSSSIYMFLTTFSDASKTQLDNHAKLFNSHCYITRIKYNGNLQIPEENRYESSILVEGSFLNFSKTHPILGFNIVEDLMFWTDNRNQPRKINIEKASERAPGNSSLPYYYSEDQISVAKYYPYNSISLMRKDGSNWSSTVKATTTEWLPISLSAPLDSIKTVGSNDVLSFLDTAQPQPAPPVDKPNWAGTAASNSSIANFFSKSGSSTSPVVRVKNASAPGKVDLFIYSVTGNEVNVAADKSSVDTQISVPAGWASPGDVIIFQLQNPEYDTAFNGDRDFLKDKFPRFSYRFKYTDNEYSLMAPFTQPVFVPAQYGSFTFGDEDNSTRTTELGFMENRASEIGLVINLPYYPGSENSTTPTINLELQRQLHIDEIEILFKSSKDNNIYVLDSVNIEDGCSTDYLVAPESSTIFNRNQFIYTYKGKKPYKVVPESDVTRVNDIVPVRAQSQETSGNRIMYGNYVDNHALPPRPFYEVTSSVKNGSFTPDFNINTNPPIASTINNKIKEYYNATLKQGRNYQVGVVFSDRYGRQSTVMLADETSVYGTGAKERSTVFAPYDNSGASDVINFFGNSLKVDFYQTIPDKQTWNPTNYPGLYNAFNQNLGWYSYKIVVKQQQQEYYNMFLPGSMSGNVVYKNNETQLSYSDSFNISNLSLYGDNINKLPRDMTNVGPTDRIYGSKESLYFRVVQPNYTYSGNSADASTVDVNRWNSRQTQLPVLESTVVSIQPFLDMGKWTTQKGVASSISYPGGYEYPAATLVPGTTDPLVKSDNNPFVANVDNGENKDRVGFFSTQQVSNITSASPNVNDFAQFSKSLIVAETKPTQSDLDLYWETTTSGLISELNTGIGTQASSTAPSDLTTFSFTGDESILYDGTTLGKSLLNSNINIVTKNGSVNVNNTYSISINSVEAIDTVGNSQDVTDYFEMYEDTSTTPKTYNIKLNQTGIGVNSFLYFDSDNPGNWGNKEIKFNFKLEIDNELPTTVSKANNFFSNAAPTMGSTPNPSADAPYDSGWNGDGWAFSIGGEEPDAGQTNVDYVKTYPMFEKSGISTDYEVTSTSISNVRSRNERFFTQYNVPGATTAEDPKFNPGDTGWNNGSYIGEDKGSELYIEKLECAVYDKNHNELYPFLEWIIADGAQMPLKVDFGGLYGGQGLRYTWREYPWKVEYVDVNDPIWSGLSSLNFASGYYLFANENYPPFEWHGAAREKNNGRFWAEGFLNGGDYSVHKITIGVKETFQDGKTSQPNQFVVYTKLYR